MPVSAPEILLKAAKILNNFFHRRPVESINGELPNTKADLERIKVLNVDRLRSYSNVDFAVNKSTHRVLFLLSDFEKGE